MPVTNARVAFSVALSLLALPSLSPQERTRISDSFPDPYEITVNGPPSRSTKWNENNDFSGPLGHNKWGSADIGSRTGGHGPPGLTDGSPPGLNDKRLSSWNKMNTESSPEGGNHPIRNYLNNSRSTQKPYYDRENPYDSDDKRPSSRNKMHTESRFEGENHSIRSYLNNDRSTQKPYYNRENPHDDSDDKRPSSWNKVNTENPFEGENHPIRNNLNNGRSTQKPYYDRENPYDSDDKRPSSRNKVHAESPSEGENHPIRSYLNNDRSTQKPYYDRENPHDNSDDKHPSSWNKVNTENPSESENHPIHNNLNNGRSTQKPYYDRENPHDSDEKRPSSWNKANTENPEGENHPIRSYLNNGRSTQKSYYNRENPRDDSDDKRPSSWNKANTENPSEGENYPIRSLNNGRSIQKPYYDRENLHDSDDRVLDDRNEYRQCRSDEFRCGSNECLPRSVKCDDRTDCRDASDEEFCISNRNQRNGCVLPEQPEGGHYELSSCDERCTERSGDTVPKNSILNYTCKSNYILRGNTISVCVDNEWYQPPSCHKVCPPLNSTSVDISCSYQGETVSCSERIMPGTRAALACKSSYKLPLTNDPAYREITCLDDGLWDRRLFRCLPECGTSISHGNTLIVNGFQAKIGVFPWHVGIYAKERGRGEYQQICSGTLISNNLVVSAAHCFYDEVYNKLHSASKYVVAAGKHYRDWNAREKYAQQSSVESIQAGGRYQGVRGNFADDVALLKLKTPFELTTLVRPVCVDWDNAYEREQLQVGHVGKVVGWGRDIRGESAKSLQEIDMPFVPYDQCLSGVPVDFRGFLTSDKFCAGHLNGSSVCDGDSGGGLCFEKDGIWYLRGIVSVSPEKRGSCDYNSYVGFTSISHFRDWIREAYVNS